MDWLTQASCSGFQAGVFGKCVRTLQLCSARTSKGQPELFEQWLPSIYRGSDGRKVTDMYEVTVRMQRDTHANIHPGDERSTNTFSLPVQGQ